MVSLNLEFLSSSPKFLKVLLRHRIFTIFWVTYVNLRSLLQQKEFYGQLYEDREISKWIPEAEGTYIDIGAGYPIRGSNSYYFYQKGWSGIAVEPILTNCIAFKFFRPRDEVIHSLMGLLSKPVTFFHIEPYEYSTTNPEIAIEMLKKPGTRLMKETFHKQIRLDSLEVTLKPEQPSFISIDVEGSDLEVLKSNDWNRIRPRIICVEEWADKFNKEDNVQKYLENQGYVLVGNVSPSLIFAEKEWMKKVKNEDYN